MAYNTKAAVERLVAVISDLSTKITQMDTKLNDCNKIIQEQRVYIERQEETIMGMYKKLDLLSKTPHSEPKSPYTPSKSKKKGKKGKKQHSPGYKTADSPTKMYTSAQFNHTSPLGKIPAQLQVTNALNDSGPQGLTAFQSSLNVTVESPSPPVQSINRNTFAASVAAGAMGVGSQGTKSLSAAPPRTTSLHLFNFSTSTSIDDITEHVKRLIKTGEIRCEQLITSGDYSSFRLDVPAASLKTVRNHGV
ncbi:hypothetical protein O0L34_g19280 [Tuta absoluta]|nr:hypothetical protein O0L34_g19280 [Tuta absoluta]